MPPKVTDLPNNGDGPGEDKPPRQERQARTRARQQPREDKPKPRTPADRKLAASVAGGYQMIGTVLTGIGLRIEDGGLAATGVATVNQSEMIAEAWMDLADQNPKVKATLKRMTEVSTIGVLVSLHISVAVPLLMDRGVIPPQFGAVMFAGADPNGNGGGDG